MSFCVRACSGLGINYFLDGRYRSLTMALNTKGQMFGVPANTDSISNWLQNADIV